MKQNSLKQQDDNAATSPFTIAIHFALADTDIAQAALFDQMLGKPYVSKEEKETGGVMPSQKHIELQEQQTENTAPTLTINTFLEMVSNDVDYRPQPILPSDLRKQLDEFRQDFITSVYGATNLDGLLKSLEQYVAKEHERLYYQTNDFMSASIKYDYFSQFTDALCKHLNETGQLDTDQLNRIEDIENIYKLGINGYNLACSKLYDATDNSDECGTRSFLARAAQRDAKEGPAVASTSVSLEEHAHEVMRELLFDTYGIVSKTKAPPALLMVLGEMTEKLALSQLQATHPHLDFRDPELASGEMMQERYEALLDTLHARIKSKPTLQRTYDVYLDLKKQICEFQHLPDDFSALIEDATKAADKKTANSIPRIFGEHLDMKQVPIPRAQKMIDALHPSFDTDGNLTTEYWSFKQSMHGLKKAEDKYELLEFIDNSLDNVADGMAVRGVHPAMALVAKEYLETFRRHLGAAMHKAGCHDERFLGALKEMEMKADLIHENQREIGHWLMQDTNGGHDNPFHHVMMTMGTETSIDKAEIDRLAENAFQGVIEAAESRGIPSSLCEQTFVPLIYGKCRDIAQAEMARDHTIGCNNFDAGKNVSATTHWVDSVTATRKPSLGKLQDQYDEREPMAPDELLSKVKQRTLVLFDQAISCLLPEHMRLNAETETADHDEVKENIGNDGNARAGNIQADEPEINDRFANCPIEFSAHNLKRIMEFLDYMDRPRSVMQLH